MDDSTIKGLEQRYVVIRLDGKPAGPCFVLDPSNDKVALASLGDVADRYLEAGYGALAEDLLALRRVLAQLRHTEVPPK